MGTPPGIVLGYGHLSDDQVRVGLKALTDAIHACRAPRKR
jgi:hypothetical protein